MDDQQSNFIAFEKLGKRYAGQSEIATNIARLAESTEQARARSRSCYFVNTAQKRCDQRTSILAKLLVCGSA